jgi:hypothetical protein
LIASCVERRRRYENPWLVVVAAAVVPGATIKFTTQANGTHLESAPFEFIAFAAGIAVSWYLGRQSVKHAAAELVRPAASSALRRLVSIGRGCDYSSG